MRKLNLIFATIAAMVGLGTQASVLSSENDNQDLAYEDVTSIYIVNPTPTANSNGWQLSGRVGYGNNCAEYWNQKGASIKQTVILPEGRYRLTVIALQRTGRTGYIEANGQTTTIAQVNSSVVNNLHSADLWFNSGNGVNEIVFTLSQESEVTIGVTADNNTSDYWTVWRSFKLEKILDNITSAKAAFERTVQNAQNIDKEIIPEAAYAALMAMVTSFTNSLNDTATVDMYLSANQDLESAIQKCIELKESYSSYKSLRSLIIKVRNTDGLTERTVGAFATFQYNINDADATAESSTTIEGLEGAINKLHSTLYTMISNVIPTLDNPIDLTFLFVNPDFEEGSSSLPGWKCSGNSSIMGYMGKAWNIHGVTSAVGNSYVNGDVSIEHFIEAWDSNTIGDVVLFQTLEGLPVGQYRLTTDAIAVSQFDESRNPVIGTYIFIKSGQIETRTEIHTGNGLPEHFEVDFICDYTGDMDFGLKTVSTTANWIAADNFRLYYVASLDESPGVSELKKTIYRYSGIEFGPCDAAVLSLFTQELNIATKMSQTDIYSSSHSAECLAEVETLKGLYDAMMASVSLYTQFQEQVDGLQNSLNGVLSGSPLLTEAQTLIDQLQTSIDQGTATVESFVQAREQATARYAYWQSNLADEIATRVNAIQIQLGAEMEYSVKDGFITNANLSGKGIKGLFPLSQLLTLPHIAGINLEGNAITSLDAIWNESVSVNLKYQTYTDVVDFNLSNANDSTLLTQLPPLFIYDGGKPTPMLGLCAKGDTWEIEYSKNVDSDTPQFILSTPFIYDRPSGDTITLTNNYGDAYGSTIPLRLSFDEGDASFDGIVDVADVQTIINYIFNELDGNPFCFTAANLWEDERINVQDLVKEVDLLLGQPIPKSTTEVKAFTFTDNRLHRVLARRSDSNASLYFANGVLLLNTETPVSALDICVSTGSSFDYSKLKALGFNISTRKTDSGIRIIAYTLDGADIPAGITALAVTSDNSAVVEAATVTDRKAKNLKVTLNRTDATGIAEIGDADLTGASSSDALYDLSGRKMLNVNSPNANLPRGIYIHNGHKVVVK